MCYFQLISWKFLYLQQWSDNVLPSMIYYCYIQPPSPPPLIWYSWVFFWHDWIISMSFTMSLITFTVIITIFINIYINNIVKWKECSSIPIFTLSWMTLLFSVTFICNRYNFYSFSSILKSLLLTQQIFQFIFDRSWEEKKNSN